MDAHLKQKKASVENIVVLLFLMLLFVGCVRQLGSPWNCDEARAAKETAASEYNESLNVSSRSTDRDDAAWAQVKAGKLVQAEAKVYQLCKNN